ncbi:hypothetical protein V6N13_034322 [Hibiscus sabdariffa]|uniref:Uncharacterized protein n=1 Tax=Hibiscus sabdariffa TaxID=183260 RepID=A0ABR2F7T9_9ROSI
MIHMTYCLFSCGEPYLKEKARLQEEAKAAEDAQRRAVTEAAAEARRKRELEREATSSRVPVDETSLGHSQEGSGSFKFGSCNPLEQLGLFMKDDDKEEEDEKEELPQPPNSVNDVAEEGEIV